MRIIRLLLLLVVAQAPAFAAFQKGTWDYATSNALLLVAFPTNGASPVRLDQLTNATSSLISNLVVVLSSNGVAGAGVSVENTYTPTPLGFTNLGPFSTLRFAGDGAWFGTHATTNGHPAGTVGVHYGPTSNFLAFIENGTGNREITNQFGPATGGFAMVVPGSTNVIVSKTVDFPVIFNSPVTFNATVTNQTVINTVVDITLGTNVTVITGTNYVVDSFETNTVIVHHIIDEQYSTNVFYNFGSLVLQNAALIASNATAVFLPGLTYTNGQWYMTGTWDCSGATLTCATGGGGVTNLATVLGVGNSANNLKIVDLAPGTDPGDAVNLAQLSAVVGSDVLAATNSDSYGLYLSLTNTDGVVWAGGDTNWTKAYVAATAGSGGMSTSVWWSLLSGWQVWSNIYLSGALTISNNVTATGTITAGHFVGDGALLTGITASQIGVVTNQLLRATLLPGAALVYGSISNATLIGVAAGGYGVNYDALTFDPTLPQLAPWQVNTSGYTGGTITVRFAWSEPVGGSVTNVWAVLTAKTVTNAVLPTTFTAGAVLTQAVGSVAGGVVIGAAVFTPDWTAGSALPAWLALQRVSTNAFNTAGSTSSVFVVEVGQ